MNGERRERGRGVKRGTDEWREEREGQGIKRERDEWKGKRERAKHRAVEMD